jgi:hypothetical protein
MMIHDQYGDMADTTSLLLLFAELIKPAEEICRDPQQRPHVAPADAPTSLPA